MQIIDKEFLDRLSEKARLNPRRRMNHNLHRSYDEPCQRLLIAIEPDSYVRPHRHLAPAKPECFLAVRGRMAVVIFNDDGTILRCIPMAAGDLAGGVDIPAGVWHAAISLASGSVFFEAKPGPYQPVSDKDFAPWAPPEGSPEASAYLADLRRAANSSSEE